MVTLQETVDVQRDRVLDLLSEGKEAFGVVGAVCVPLPPRPVGPQLLIQSELVFWGTLTTAVMVVPMEDSVYVLTMDRGFPAEPPSPAIATVKGVGLMRWPVDALTALVTNACGFFHVDTASSKKMVILLKDVLEVSSGRSQHAAARAPSPAHYPLTLCDHPYQPMSTRLFCNCPPSCTCRLATCPPIDGYYPRDTWADPTPPVRPTAVPPYIACPRCGQTNQHPARPHADQHCAYCREPLAPPVQQGALTPPPWSIEPPWTAPTAPQPSWTRSCPRCGAAGYDITTGGCGACGAPF